jgi:hypothetical protein
VERGDGGPGPTGGVCEVRSATAGQPVRLLVGWDDAKSAGVGRFEVGDLLRAWPREEALALASYRQSVEAFLDSRIELEEPMGKAAREAALPEGEALEGPEAVEAAVEADEPLDQWAEAPDGLARAERLGEATGAARGLLGSLDYGPCGAATLVPNYVLISICCGTFYFLLRCERTYSHLLRLATRPLHRSDGLDGWPLIASDCLRLRLSSGWPLDRYGSAMTPAPHAARGASRSNFGWCGCTCT